MSQYMAKSNLFYAVSKIAVSSLLSLNKSQTKLVSGYKTLNCFNTSKFHPDQLKNVWKNDAKRFRFVLTLWPQGKVKVIESGIK